MFRGPLCALLVMILAPAAIGRAEFQVNSHTEHSQIHPAVAMNGTGRFVVTWRSHVSDGRGGGVYARCFHANGTPVGNEFKANVSEADMDNWTPAVAMSASGDVVMAWVGVADGDRRIIFRMFDMSGRPLTDEIMIGVSTADVFQSMPSIAMNSAGAFVIVWTNWCGTDQFGKNCVAGRVFEADGSPMSGEIAIGVQAQAHGPDVAMDDSGNFVVAWIRMGDTFNRPYGEFIMFRRFEADGTPMGGAVCVTGDINSRWYGPSIAADPAGQFAITWAVGPFPHDICMQTFDAAGAPMTAPYVINTYLQGNQGHPCIATTGQGKYLAVWDSHGQDGDACGVFGQWCGQDGMVEGPELAVNTCTAGRQWYPKVAVTADGRYVVVWISEGQDGSDYGIFAEMGSE